MHLDTRSEGNFKRTGSWGLWDRFRCTCHIKILYGDSEGANLILNIFLPEISVKTSESRHFVNQHTMAGQDGCQWHDFINCKVLQSALTTGTQAWQARAVLTRC
eukprot:g73526.t1